MKIGKQLGDVSNATLRFFRQIGVEEVGMPSTLITTLRRSRPMVPPAQMGPAEPQPESWDEAELVEIRTRIERVGLVPTVMTLPLSSDILLGGQNRDSDLEKIRGSIRVAGNVGIRVLVYNFTALRASEGYYLRSGAGRGGADLRAFDASRIKDHSPLETVGSHTQSKLWSNLEYFLAAVIPVAEEANVRLAAHPNDPPLAEFRGVGQPLHTLGDLERLIACIDSPANSVFVDTGVLTEVGSDPVAAIQYFGVRDRIGMVHFRNVKVSVPNEDYTETFLDDGDCDMLACARALHDVGYARMIEPDHTPDITNDTRDTWAGWAFAIGQMIALRAAVSG